MNFDFDDEQYAFRDVFARYLVGAFPAERRQDADAGFDDQWRGLADLGLFALLVPEAHGGLGRSFVDLGLIVEELGKVLAPVAITDTLVATEVIARFASDDTAAALLPRIAAGDCRIAIAMTEPGVGYDPARTVAALGRRDNERTIGGTKLNVAHGADADLILTLARDETGDVAAVLVKRDQSGVTVRMQSGLDPSCHPAAIDFDGAIAEPLGGAVAAARLFDAGAMVSAGLLTGIADAALALTLDYARQRMQFGKAIGSFQTIKHRCADMAVAADGARSASYYADWAVAEDAPDRARAVSIAKAFCGETARTICNDAIQIHGGMGFTWELGVHHFLKRSKVLEYAFGDAAFHKERVMATTLAGLVAAAGQAA